MPGTYLRWGRACGLFCAHGCSSISVDLEARESKSARVHGRACVCVSVRVRVRVRVYTYICVHVYMHTFLYMYYVCQIGTLALPISFLSVARANVSSRI